MSGTTTSVRTDRLRQAVTLMATADVSVLEEIFGKDITIWSPGRLLMSRDELIDELRKRDQAFSNFQVEIMSLDLAGNRGYAEWVATADHTADLVDGDLVIEASGTPITVYGMTVASFDGDRIVALRQYWDELSLLTDLGVLPAD